MQSERKMVECSENFNGQTYRKETSRKAWAWMGELIRMNLKEINVSTRN